MFLTVISLIRNISMWWFSFNMLLYSPCLNCHSFLWWYVVFLSGCESVQVFFIICLWMHCSWRSSYQEGRVTTLLNGLTTSHLLYRSQTRTWNSNVICHGFLCSGSSVKIRDDCSFCWYWWNWWLSLFKLSFHKMVYHLVASAEISQFVIKRCIFFLCLLLVLTLWYGWYGHTNTIPIYWRGRRSRGRMVAGFTTVQTVLFTTKVVSLNSAHGQVSLIQHYVINFVCELWQVSGFFWVLRFPPPIKLTATYWCLNLTMLITLLPHLFLIA
jgi:hypothetical protein